MIDLVGGWQTAIRTLLSSGGLVGRLQRRSRRNTRPSSQDSINKIVFLHYSIDHDVISLYVPPQSTKWQTSKETFSSCSHWLSMNLQEMMRRILESHQ